MQEDQTKSLPIPKFEGCISKIFEPYLCQYTQAVEKELEEQIEKLLLEDQMESNDNPVFASSLVVFRSLNTKLMKCKKIAGQSTIFDLHFSFKRSLDKYCKGLQNKLTKQTDDNVICVLINTAQQCRATIYQMEQAFKDELKSSQSLSQKIDYDEQREVFDMLSLNCLNQLLGRIETNLELILSQLSKTNWQELEGVGDISEYVKDIQNLLEKMALTLINMLSEEFYVSFLNKLVVLTNNQYVNAIKKCKRISEYGAQQLLLDVHELKNTILSLQTLSKKDGEKYGFSNFYLNHVNRTVNRTENLLKVISQPPTKVLGVYQTLMGEDVNQDELEKILNLQGVKRSEYPQLFEALKKGSDHPSKGGIQSVKKLIERFT